ncbi:MAG: response regulator [Oscillospiraceae bacterium]|nr:response regulator [Oscillospiraceae bacterium]
MRVLVVDDEKIGRDGISFLLRQFDSSFEIHEAENGKEAMALLQQSNFDILLTDIKMPFMNGLELSKAARELQESLQIVIFSGYSDFAYAKQAIQYGVSDYVLKPVDPDEFTKTMKRVTECVTEKQHLLEVRNELYRIEGDYCLRQFLINGNSDDLKKAQDFTDTSLWQDCGCLILAESSTPVFAENPLWLLPEELRRSLSCSFSFLVLQDTRAVFVFGQQLPCSRKMLAQSLLEYFDRHCPNSVRIAVSEPLSGAANITGTFRHLGRLLSSRRNADRLLFVGSTNLSASPDESVLQQLLKDMKESLRRRNISALWKDFYAMRNCCSAFPQAPVTAAVKFTVSSLIHSLWEAAAPENPQEMGTVLASLYSTEMLAQALHLLEQSICTYENSLSLELESVRTDVNMVRDYIAKHYDEDLSVEILAEKVYLSPSYLSVIFKKETGQNLNSYIRTYRLSQAKRLLETTNMKIVQVCQKTGFTNVSYFCKRFRESFGTSPHNFQKAEIDENE